MVERLILIFSALLLAISASAALPSTHLLIDLLSHFRFQYFGAAGLGVLLICLIFGNHAQKLIRVESHVAYVLTLLNAINN